MKSILFLLAVSFLFSVVVGFTENEYQLAFTNWMQGQGKAYTAEEFGARYTIFKSNMDFVHEFNSKNNTFTVGLNRFADLTNEEYRATYLGTHFDGTSALAAAARHHARMVMPTVNVPVADTIDWRTRGAVTPIKDQGQCGSCWSFSTTGSVEGIHQISTGKLVSLSEQNLMDCSTAYGNQGCNGGLMTNAFQYIIKNPGIDTEASYPYQTKQGTCRFSTANVGATITGYKNVPAGSESGLVTAVNSQPVSIAIDASHQSFQLYSSGIYYESQCSSSQLDHGVLAVGYGSNGASADYWIVKNSWGVSWGMQGFIQMARNRNNNCGVATMASYPQA
jgi:cathepsin L